ncbi:LPS assembly lipoprotein LptE [Jannaschia sp. 2305UL9-9]|uniref:LPS assembly lipoprotein LptE n=1 Tax=Jannaschia sp. 2305UL9-9 TaxID=3121638 RepID=UPI003529435D
MSWSRRLVLTGAAATLAACGFTPVYGPDGGGAALRGAVRVMDPDTDFGFAFVTRFEDRLGLPTAVRYDLSYTFVTEEVDLAIDGSNNITRFNIEGTLVWTLTALGSDDVVLSGREVNFTSYSATGSTISTLESERDANRRLAVIMADAIVTRLLSEAASL